MIFGLHVIWEVQHERLQCLAHEQVVADRGAKEDGHEHDGTGSCVDGEEANEADFREVDTCHELLKGLAVRGAFGVDVVRQDVERIVACSEVDESKTNCRKAQDKRRDNGVCDCLSCVRFPLLSWDRVLPMIPRLPNLGYIDPHPSPDKVMKRLNIFLGDLSRNFPTTVNIASAPMFNISPAAIPSPCNMK